MHRNLFVALAMVCCLAVPALGAVTIVAGDHSLLPNTPGQVVQVVISSDIPQGIGSADLGLQVGDGITGPVITAVDMTSPGTIFGDAAGGNTGQTDFEAFPTLNQLSSIATTAGDTPAFGVLANVTFDTTGTPAGLYEFNLVYAPFFLAASTSSIPAQETILVDGLVGCILCPEPASVVLGLFADAGLGLVAIRRRLRHRRIR